MTTSDDPPVRIEVAGIDSLGRQIGVRDRVTELLADRAADIRAAVAQAADVVQASATALRGRDGWQVETVQAKFGIKLAAQAGVVLSNASTEASFEITITVGRRPPEDEGSRTT
jgi:hypothetical protein